MYTVSGYHRYNESQTIGDKVTTSSQKIDVSTTGKGLYGVAKYETLKPYLSQEINAWLVYNIKSVDESPVEYSCMKINGNVVSGSATTVNYRRIAGGSGISYVIKTYIFDNCIL